MSEVGRGELTLEEWARIQPLKWRTVASLRRKGRGQPRLRPHGLAGDKAYSSRAIRHDLRLRHLPCIIPRRKDECRKIRFDRDTYCLAMATIASILVWLRFAETS